MTSIDVLVYGSHAEACGKAAVQSAAIMNTWAFVVPVRQSDWIRVESMRS